MKNLIIGSHVSFKSDSQLLGSVKEALAYNANTFMFYTGAPQNTTRVPINDSLTLEAMKLMKDNGMDLRNIIVHAPYIINPANSTNHAFCIDFLRKEIERVEELGVTKLVLHPGSHVSLGEDVAINNIIATLNSCVLSDTKVDICIETMAGKGSEVGINLNQIKRIVDGVLYNNKIKVCLDTCHLNDAGYDLSKFSDYLDEFDKEIGIDKIACIHINDSKNMKGSKKDRHENIGFGTIGFNNLLNIIYEPRLENVPKILETPYLGDSEEDKKRIYPPYKFEIEMIKEKQFNQQLLKSIRDYYK